MIFLIFALFPGFFGFGEQNLTSEVYKSYEERISENLNDCGFFDESVQKCADRVQHAMEFYTSDKFTCAVSYTYPVAAWKTWAGEATRYQIYGICGLKTTLKITGSTLQASCEAAASRCGYDTTCIRDKVDSFL